MNLESALQTFKCVLEKGGRVIPSFSSDGNLKTVLEVMDEEGRFKYVYKIQQNTEPSGVQHYFIERTETRSEILWDF